MKNWTLEELKKELNARPEIKGWIIQQEVLERRERYFLSERSTPESALAVARKGALAIDQDREVKNLSITGRIFVKKEDPTRQGEIRKKFFSAMPLKPQVDSAIEAARQTSLQSWELPSSIPQNIPQLQTADPKIAEDMNGSMEALTDRLRQVLSEKRESEFNSAEIFLSTHHREFHLSNGLIHRSSQTRVYAESAFSYSKSEENGQTASDEYMTTLWSVSLKDMPLEKLFRDASENATHTLDVDEPRGGRYPVILHEDVLSNLFNGHVKQLSAFNSYNGLPYKKPGEELITGAEADLLTLTVDPTLEYGSLSSAVSAQGLLQAPLQLVRENRVVSSMADKQYAQYLGLEPTTSVGNVVIEPGTLSFEEMTRKEPLVLEILQFSGLFADPNSGTYSSEIRLGRLYDNKKGTVRYIKGGSLSGSINENFRKAYLSKDRVKFAYFESGGADSAHGYFGPKCALLYDVSIAGA